MNWRTFISSRVKESKGELLLLCLALVLIGSGKAKAAEAPEGDARAPIKIAKVKHSSAVNFEREILPIFRRNCLACHNRTTTKAGVLLESPEDVLKGGDNGKIVVPKRSGESSLLKVSSHQSDPVMPPRGNKASAVELTPEELGLLKLWIDQGAKGEVRREVAIDWQPLPPGLNPIYATAITGDGQYAAAGRANQIHLYHLPTGQLVERLSDAALLKSGLYTKSGVAHRDMIYSLAFSPDGTRLASGSYREVKVWQRVPESPRWQFTKAGEVAAMAASPDGRWLATGGADGKVRLWDLVKGKSGRTLSGQESPMVVVQFSPDGTRLFSVGTNMSLIVWEAVSCKVLARAALPGAVSAAVWNREGGAVVTGGEDKVIRVWNLPLNPKEPMTVVKELKGHAGAITSLAVVATGPAEIISGSTDGSVRSWDLTKGEMVKQFDHGGAVCAVAVRTDGKRMASAGTNKVTRLWNLEDGKVVAELKGNPDRQRMVATRERELAAATAEIDYRKAAVATAEKEVTTQADRVKKGQEAVAAADKVLVEKKKPLDDAVAAKVTAEKEVSDLVMLWEAKKMAAEAAQKAATESDAAAKEAKTKAATEAKVDFDKINGEFAAKKKAADDKVVSLEKTRVTAETEFKKAEQTRIQADTEAQLAAKAEEKAKLATEAAKGALKDAEAAKVKADEFLAAAKKANDEAIQVVRLLSFSPDERLLMSLAEGQRALLWNAADGTAAGSLVAGGKGLMALTREGLLAASEGKEGVMVWETRPAWKLERTIGTGSAGSLLVDRVNALAFTADGEALITGGGEPSRDGELKVWKVADGSLQQTIRGVHSDSVQALAISPDGKWLATGAADRLAKVVSLDKGVVLKTLEGHTHHVLGVAWKGDNRTLATASMDKVVKIWDVTTGERKRNIEGYGREVTSILTLANAGQWLTTTGDNRVRVVDEAGKEVKALSGAKDYLHCSAVTPDGRHVVVGGQDSVLLYWRDGGEPFRLGMEPELPAASAKK
jgi:WD40 repeat protein